jgi:hypothetical protein
MRGETEAESSVAFDIDIGGLIADEYDARRTWQKQTYSSKSSRSAVI